MNEGQDAIGKENASLLGTLLFPYRRRRPPGDSLSAAEGAMILRFSSNEEREQFLRLGRDRLDIFSRCKSARRLPHVIVKGTDAEQAQWIRDHVGENRAYSDIQFQTFS